MDFPNFKQGLKDCPQLKKNPPIIFLMYAETLYLEKYKDIGNNFHDYSWIWGFSDAQIQILYKVNKKKEQISEV
jgi:hypothetical protein